MREFHFANLVWLYAHAQTPLASSYAQYREQKKEQHEAWLKRKEERELRLARGEDVGPEELDPTDEPEVGCLGLLKFIVISAVVILLAGKFFTGSYLWEHDLSGLRKYIPVSVSPSSASSIRPHDVNM